MPELDTFGKIFSLISSIVVALTFCTGVVWYVWRGKSTGRLTESLTHAQSLIDTLKETNNQMSISKTIMSSDYDKIKCERDQVRDESERTRKLNLRLQGRVDKLEKQLGIYDSDE